MPCSTDSARPRADRLRAPKWLSAGAAVLALACSGLPTEPITSAGDFQRSFELNGETRRYRVHVPATLDLRRPAPLLLAFHGVPSAAQEMRLITDFDIEAAAEELVVVYPETSRSGDWNHSCRDCSGAGALEFDDIEFTERIIEKMGKDMSIDAQRIYVTGFSQGALMAFRIACELSSRVAAVATVAATMLDWQGNNCGPARPVPIVMIHGTADEEFPPGGRRGVQVSSVSVDATVTHWVDTNRCNPTPAVINLPDVTPDGTTVSRSDYSGCNGGAEVVFYRVDGGGHTWPGSPYELSPLLGVTSEDLDASDAIVDFMLRFSR